MLESKTDIQRAAGLWPDDGVHALLPERLVLIPIGGLVVRTLGISWHDFWTLATTDRALAAYQLTFGASFIAALANVVFGTLLVWVLTRCEFPRRRLIDALVTS